MLPRIKTALLEAFNSGLILDKHMAAASIHCDIRSVARIMATLHELKELRIHDWIESRGGYIPVYVLADGKPDKQKPKIKTESEARYQRARRRASKEIRDREAAVKRNDRLLKRKVTYGIFGI